MAVKKVIALRWLIIALGFYAALEINLNSDSYWHAGFAPLLTLVCFFVYLFTHPLERYLENPEKFHEAQKEARKRANERATMYDGGEE